MFFLHFLLKMLYYSLMGGMDMQEELMFSVSFKCDKDFLNDFEAFKAKLSNSSPIRKRYSNAEIVKHLLKEYMDNYDNEHNREWKLELIKEIVNR